MFKTKNWNLHDVKHILYPHEEGVNPDTRGAENHRYKSSESPVKKQSWMDTLDRACMAVLKHLCGFKSSSVAFVEL